MLNIWDFQSLVTRGQQQKQKNWWITKAKGIHSSLQNGVDIITRDVDYRKELETIYGVKMTTSEIKLYEDNCVPVSDKNDPNFGRCQRSMWSGDIDKNWLSAAKKRQIRIQKEHERSMKYEAEKEKGNDSQDIPELSSDDEIEEQHDE